MKELIAGGNASVPSSTLRIKIISGKAADISAYSLYDNDKVSGDSDMVFYGQKTNDDLSINLIEEGLTSVFEVNLSKMRAAVKKVAFALTCDKNETIQSLGKLAIQVESAGECLIAANSELAGRSEAALILGELYRRNDEWKFRFISQGFNGGLKPLAEHFGIEVADDEPAVSTPAPAAPAPVSTPAPASAPVAGPSGKVSLTKHQSVSLTKMSSALSKVDIGLGWDPVSSGSGGGFFGKLLGGGGSIDLDASCILLDANNQLIENVWFMRLKSKCRSVIHHGDNLTGEGDGDDEVITVDLKQLPANVSTLAFTVNSFRGQTFNQVANAFCRVVDSNKKELVRYNLTEQGGHTGVFIASLSRNHGDWTFKAHGIAINGRTVKDMIPQIKRELSQ